MKVSYNWLRELCPALAEGAVTGAPALAERLTAAGLEIEGLSPLGDEMPNVIVAEVRASRKHPRADKLTLVEIFDGREVTQVVCGAPNVPPPGGRVVWARPGARLPDGLVLDVREVRGVTSPGMLCAEDELGLGKSHEGILILGSDVAPGSRFDAAVGLPDVILDVNVTPNRPDCLGHVGLAREAAALLFATNREARLTLPDADLDGREGPEPAETLAAVELADAEGCPRYLARVITGITVGPSPLWVRLRLQSLGVRAINNVVDATNLALLETGHPLHAFDLDKLAGRRIVVRRARDGEPIVTLDGQERRLAVEDVAICDAERPVAIAGVMGGRESEVGPGTTRLLLESAYFDPARVRRTARRLGLHTEASHRFERGADPNEGVALSSRRCARMIVDFAGGRVAGGALDAYPRPIGPRRVELRPSRTSRVLGTVVPLVEQLDRLAALGLTPREDGPPPQEWVERSARTEKLVVEVPTYRPDLTREIDLIEEIARLRGYDGIPATLPRLTIAARGGRDLRDEAVRDGLAALGLTEVITYAFVGPDRIAALGYRDWRGQPLRLENPLREELSALRTSLAPGLLGALQRNLVHNTGTPVGEVRLFEVGKVFCPPSGEVEVPRHLPARGKDALLPVERRCVGGVLAGRREGWLKPGEPIDFFDVKGVVEAVLDALGVVALIHAPTEPVPWLHPGACAVVTTGPGATSWTAGALGEVHPAVRAQFGIEERAFAFELDLEALGGAEPVAAQPPPRFPGSARDFSFFVDERVPAADLQAVMAASSPLIESVRVLEDYREAGRVPPGRKGMLFSLFYRSPERTLTDEEVAREHATVLEELRLRFAVEQR